MIRQSVLLFFIALAGVCLASGARVEVDPAASEFRVDVKATGHSFEVFLDTYSADIDLNEEGGLERANFNFECAALESDNAKRDRKMLKWLEHDTHGEISFTLSEVKAEADGFVGMGDLNLHGVTRPLRVPFSMEKNDGKVTLTGTATVDHRDYDLEVITMLLLKVNPELKVSFKLVGVIEE